MANPIEAAKNYLVSVADRMTGINAYKEQLHSSPKNRLYPSFCRITQILAPTVYEATKYITTEDADPDSSTARFRRNRAVVISSLFASIGVDTAGIMGPAMLAIATSRNPLEFVAECVAYRVAASAATHAGLDLTGAAAERIKRFRPRHITLTI